MPPADAQRDPGDESAEVPVEPNGHLLTEGLRRREVERRRDEAYRAMRPTADEIARRLLDESRRQADQ